MLMTATGFAFYVRPLLSDPAEDDRRLLRPGGGHPTVRAWARDGRATIEVTDDGVGGAEAALGSGLRGLADRVERSAGRCSSRARLESARRSTAEIPVT
jgi:hypothetical protein